MDKKDKRIRVLEERDRRNKKRLLKIKVHAEKIQNITSQIKINK